MSSSDPPFGVPGASPSEGPMPSTGATDEEEIRAARAANRFDIRRLIGGLFVLYGLILTIMGLVGSHQVKTKAAGINVDLWTGLAMLVFGALTIGGGGVAAYFLWRGSGDDSTNEPIAKQEQDTKGVTVKLCGICRFAIFL